MTEAYDPDPATQSNRKKLGTSAQELAVSAVGRLSLALLPRNRFGDRLIALIKFVRTFRRFPRNEMRLPDYLYRMKTSDEMLNPLRTFVTDKAWVKRYVQAMVGERYNVPTLGVLDSTDAVRNFDFPEDCCVKPTHLSGAVEFNTASRRVNRARVLTWMTQNHYDSMREVNHRYLKPRVIVEPLLFGDENIRDYKVFCYQGEPKLIQVDLDRHTRHSRLFYTTDWDEEPYSMLYPRAEQSVARPPNLEELLWVSRVLAQEFEFVRVDLYSNDEACFVGELTNCPGSGDEPFIPAHGEEQASRRIFS